MKSKSLLLRAATGTLLLLLLLLSIPGSAQLITANDDEEPVWKETLTHLYITQNDDPAATVAVANYQTLIPPQHGQTFYWDAVLRRVVYKPQNGFTGQDSFKYKLCILPPSPFLPSVCDEAWVYITVTDTCVPELCVWPGDMNGDGKANNEDILSLGLGFNNVGVPRPNATTNWIGQPANNWSGLLLQVNEKHVDANGDGTLNLLDRSAIMQNYDTLSVNKAKQEHVQDASQLIIEFETEGLEPGDTAIAYLILGTKEEPFQDLYGFAVKLQYDPAVIKPYSGNADYSGSWVATGTDWTEVQRDVPTYGRFEVGFSRTDRQPKSGFGIIGMIKFEIIDNLDEKDNFINEVSLATSGVVAVNGNGDRIPVNPGYASVPLKWNEEADEDILSQHIRMYPNPAKDQLTVQFSDIVINYVEVVAMTGEVVKTYSDLEENRFTLALDALPAHFYFVKLHTNRGILTKKLIIQ